MAPCGTQPIRERAAADTSADADRVQLDAYRRLGGAGRVAIMFRLNVTTRRLACAGIRARHPTYSEQQVARAYARLVLGDAVVQTVSPDEHLVEP